MFYGIRFCFLLVLYKDLSRLMQLNFLVLRRRNQRQINTLDKIGELAVEGSENVSFIGQRFLWFFCCLQVVCFSVLSQIYFSKYADFGEKFSDGDKICFFVTFLQLV